MNRSELRVVFAGLAAVGVPGALLHFSAPDDRRAAGPFGWPRVLFAHLVTALPLGFLVAGWLRTLPAVAGAARGLWVVAGLGTAGLAVALGPGLGEGAAESDAGPTVLLVLRSVLAVGLVLPWCAACANAGDVPLPAARPGLAFGVALALAVVPCGLFAVTPPPFNFLWLFCNGLPLGMVFGLVLGYLEGRRHTEALAAGLCASFIVADGAVKSVGAALLKEGVSEFWMPFLSGLLFVPPLLLFTWMLTRIPPPSPQDVAARGARAPMNGTNRWALFRRYAPGLTLLVLVYLLITILRSVRADFAPEIWAGLQQTVPPAIFTASEIAVAVVVLLLVGSIVVLRDNRGAFFAGLALALGGVLLVVGTLLALQEGVVSPFAFMVLHGVGLYLPYIAVHTVIFERFIAMTRDRGNIAYLMQLADSFGYLGYVAVLFARNAIGPAENFLSFFVVLSWVTTGLCCILLVPCWRYFATHPATQAKPPAAGRAS